MCDFIKVGFFYALRADLIEVIENSRNNGVPFRQAFIRR
jgi:hypothetical protein